jgi:hypothetical protein
MKLPRSSCLRRSAWIGGSQVPAILRSVQLNLIRTSDACYRASEGKPSTNQSTRRRSEFRTTWTLLSTTEETPTILNSPRTRCRWCRFGRFPTPSVVVRTRIRKYTVVTAVTSAQCRFSTIPQERTKLIGRQERKGGVRKKAVIHTPFAPVILLI